MPSRRWHKKVRTGCNQCRQRHIKCDESKPICRNCERISATCKYALDYNPSPSGSRSQVVLHQPSPQSPPSALMPLDRNQLEMMYHYAVSTSASIGEEKVLADWFRDVAPTMLLPHDGLVGAMLSVTATHNAYLRPDGQARYHALAANYLNQAISALQVGLANVNQENGPALNLASIFIGIATQASASYNTGFEGQDPVTKWVTVSTAVRSGRAVFMTIQKQGVVIDRSCLPPMTSAGQQDPSQKAQFEEAITDITQVLNEHLEQCESRCPPDIHAMYVAVVGDLAMYYEAPFTREAVVGSVERRILDWNLFCRMLLAGDELCRLFALCYAALFNTIDSRWYIKGFYGEMVDFLAPKVTTMGGRAAKTAIWALGRTVAVT